jgi:sec-independent protein translocase protein TatA
MRPGLMQVLICVLIIAVLFGAKKIPELARSLGKAKGEFKKGLEEGEKELSAAEAEEGAKEKAAEPAKELA